MILQAFYELAFLTGAFQAEAETEEWAFQQCAFQADAFQADLCNDAPAILPAGGAGSNKRKHRRIHPREIWEEAEEAEEVAEKAAIVAKRKAIKGAYADIPLPDLEYAIAQLEKIVGADYDEDDVEALLLML